MKFYWRLSDIPELRPLNKAQQQEIWAATAGRRIRDPFLLLIIFPVLLMVFLGSWLGATLLPWSYGQVIGGSIGAGLGSFVGVIMTTPRARPHLAAEIRKRGLLE